jgi:PleD family two-component response regulator
MVVLKNDAMLKVLNAINEHQFAQWKTFSANPLEAAELEGEVAVLGSLFWELSDMIHDVQIYEQGANKAVYAKFTDAMNTRFSVKNNYGYVVSDTAQQEERKNGFRNGVQWVEQELAKMVLAA